MFIMFLFYKGVFLILKKKKWGGGGTWLISLSAIDWFGHLPLTIFCYQLSGLD